MIEVYNSLTIKHRFFKMLKISFMNYVLDPFVKTILLAETFSR